MKNDSWDLQITERQWTTENKSLNLVLGRMKQHLNIGSNMKLLKLVRLPSQIVGSVKNFPKLKSQWADNCNREYVQMKNASNFQVLKN